MREISLPSKLHVELHLRAGCDLQHPGELLVDGGSAGPTLQAIADRSILGHPATRVTQDIEMYIATKMMNAMMAYEGALRHSVAQVVPYPSKDSWPSLPLP